MSREHDNKNIKSENNEEQGYDRDAFGKMIVSNPDQADIKDDVDSLPPESDNSAEYIPTKPNLKKRKPSYSDDYKEENSESEESNSGRKRGNKKKSNLNKKTKRSGKSMKNKKRKSGYNELIEDIADEASDEEESDEEGNEIKKDDADKKFQELLNEGNKRPKYQYLYNYLNLF